MLLDIDLLYGHINVFRIYEPQLSILPEYDSDRLLLQLNRVLAKPCFVVMTIIKTLCQMMVI